MVEESSIRHLLTFNTMKIARSVGCNVVTPAIRTRSDTTAEATNIHPETGIHLYYLFTIVSLKYKNLFVDLFGQSLQYIKLLLFECLYDEHIWHNMRHRLLQMSE